MRFVPTILCVDDDEDDLYFIRDIINSQSFSFHIVEAKNGREAMNILEENVANKTLPCLIIMDMNMPRMDGRQTIARIRENDVMTRIPIVVFTTSSQLQDKTYFESMGIHFISKPFEYKDFKSQIIELLAFCADLGA